jgi:hypothetical protein
MAPRRPTTAAEPTQDAAPPPPAAGPGHNRPPTLREELELASAPLRAEVEAVAEMANRTPRAIKGGKDLDEVSGLIVEARRIVRAVEAERTAAKAPHLEASRTVDGFYAVQKDRVDRILGTFQKIADEYTRARAEEERRARAAEAARLREEEEAKRRQADEARRTSTKEKRANEAWDLAAQATVAEEAAAAPAADLVRTTTASGFTAGAQAVWTFKVEEWTAIDLETLRPFLKVDAIEAAIRAFVRQHHDRVPLRGVRIYQDVKARIG